MSRIEVTYSRRMPFRGIKYAGETYTATVSIDGKAMANCDYESLLAEVKSAVDRQYEKDAAELLDERGETVPMVENEPGAPAWAIEGPDPAKSLWVQEWGNNDDDSATDPQIVYIENLMFDKLIPNLDAKCTTYFRTIQAGIMSKSEAKTCISYLKTFPWKPVKDQRKAAFKKDKKNGKA